MDSEQLANKEVQEYKKMRDAEFTHQTVRVYQRSSFMYTSDELGKRHDEEICQNGRRS